MKRFIILFIIFVAGFSQTSINLDSLLMVDYDCRWFLGQKLHFKCVIYFNKDISTVINQTYKRDFTNLIITPIDINKKEDKYLIRYDPGPSFDPLYEIYKVTDIDTVRIGIVDANELTVLGDNYFYTINRLNWMYNRKMKYTIADNKIIEIKQPYYYVGLQSLTSKDIIIYQDTLYSEPVTTLAKGDSVFVLININDNYLIKTTNDLTGWVKIPWSDGGSIIYDIFKAGD